MNYIKNHKYSIEERALRYYGNTDVFEFAGYMLEDGTMLNFAYENHQRDVDHQEIGQFFSKAYGVDALCKFIRRGNIRCNCNRNGYYFEFGRKPTKKQWNKIIIAALMAQRTGKDFCIENLKRTVIITSYNDFTKYLTKNIESA